MVRTRRQAALEGAVFPDPFADDFVIGCELESDAQRLMAVAPQALWERTDDPSDEGEAGQVR